MNINDVRAIEEKFGIEFPAAYRDVLMRNPLAAEFPDEEIDLLKTNIESLLYVNQLYRDGGYYGKSWPHNAFWVGGDGGGGAYFLMCDGRENFYYINWENSSHNFESLQQLKIADSVSRFLNFVRDRAKALLDEFEH